MSEQASTFVPVARADEVEEGRPKAVRIEGRSVALFRHQGTLYATDNQCPHMGYPLTRGRVRNGVLTCDWHGWSYDMRGGGCFTGGCDDLDTYPVEERDGQVFVDVAAANSKRGDAHFLLLKEGLLSGDNWTLSKAIAILLARGVSEDETLNLLVEHMGRFIATERGPDGGRDVALLVNGVKVARLYEPADRLIPLMMAASGAAGRAGDRPQIHPLPQPITWDKLARWIRVFSADKTWEGIEKCLVTARHLGDCDDRIVPLLYECAVEPYLLGMTDNLIHLGYLAELLEEFGWGRSQLLVCNLAAKMLGRNRPAPHEARREAIDLFAEVAPVVAQYASGSGDFDADRLAAGLVSGDLEETFGAVTRVLKAGADIEQVVSTMVLLAADRMARTPVNMSPGWGDLNRELILSASVRTARRCAGDQVAARALYHAAWQFFDNRWLNIAPRPLRAHPAPQEASTGQDEALAAVIEAIETIQIREVGRLVREYLQRGFDGGYLLRELGQTILKDDNGWNLLHALRTVSEEWSRCADHPARGQLLVGLARWATDVRRNTGSQSAVQTAQRFARGETAVELYE